jgi:uncharacterized protein
MNLQTYTSAQAFLNRTRASLEKDEVVNNLMFGISLRLVDDPNWYGDTPYFCTVESSSPPGELLAAALMTPPFNLILYPASDDYLKALPLLIDNLLGSTWNVPGVLGPEAIATDFADLWSRRTGSPFRLDMRERVYELRQVIPPPDPGGRLRKAAPEDLALVLGWWRDFTREALGEEEPESISPETAQQRLQNMYLWVDEFERPVSMAAISRSTPHGSTIGPVYTPPALRRQGYAGACVAALSQVILDSGKDFCDLFTNLDYPTSNHVYQAIGYRPLGDFAIYRFDSAAE